MKFWRWQSVSGQRNGRGCAPPCLKHWTINTKLDPGLGKALDGVSERNFHTILALSSYKIKTIIVIFILIFLYRSHWSHSTQWLKNIRRKFNLKGRDALSSFSQCSDGGLGGFAEQFFVDLCGSRGRKVWFVKCSNKGLCQVPCFATWRIQQAKDWRSFHLLFCWFGNGLSGTHTIPSSAASPSTSGFASALVRSGLWGHCGFAIANERATTKNNVENLFTILDYTRGKQEQVFSFSIIVLIPRSERMTSIPRLLDALCECLPNEYPFLLAKAYRPTCNAERCWCSWSVLWGCGLGGALGQSPWICSRRSERAVRVKELKKLFKIPYCTCFTNSFTCNGSGLM